MFLSLNEQRQSTDGTCFTMGIRHSEFIVPMITNMDEV